MVIGRDHLDAGSVASPNRETEAMKDGSDAVSDWAFLNALLNCASGATWVSIHHGGGVGIGFSQHAGMVICCDGTDAAAKRIERVLWNDPATGVMRHADAGYETAIECAREHGLNLPSLDTQDLKQQAGRCPPGSHRGVRVLRSLDVERPLVTGRESHAVQPQPYRPPISAGTSGRPAIACVISVRRVPEPSQHSRYLVLGNDKRTRQ